jgi:hypothetical protein
MFQRQLVPACLNLDLDDFKRVGGVSAFLESVPTDSGWQVLLHIVGGKLQATAEFTGRIPAGFPPPAINTEVELLSGIDDAMAIMRYRDKQYEALFSRANLQGLVGFINAEPRSQNMQQPSVRFYDRNC